MTRVPLSLFLSFFLTLSLYLIQSIIVCHGQFRTIILQNCSSITLTHTDVTLGHSVSGARTPKLYHSVDRRSMWRQNWYSLHKVCTYQSISVAVNSDSPWSERTHRCPWWDVDCTASPRQRLSPVVPFLCFVLFPFRTHHLQREENYWNIISWNKWCSFPCWGTDGWRSLTETTTFVAY